MKKFFVKSLLFTTVLTSSLLLCGGCSKKDTASAGSISSFEDVAGDSVKTIALGNQDVPVGQYSEEIFTNLGIWDSIQSKVSFGGNVKEVLSQVAQGSADCGVVYATDAATEPDVKVICSAPADSIKTPVIYPAAILSASNNQDAANAFLQYLLTDSAKASFEKVGFRFYATQKPEKVTVDVDVTLTIFAAASLTESLTEIGDAFMKEYPNVTLVYNYDSSGTLKTQIESGAEADLFISAAQKQMNALIESNYIDESSKIDLLENQVVLIVPGK